MRDDEDRPDGSIARSATGAGLAAHAAFSDLAEAAGAVMRQLCRELGFRLWALTRVSGSTYTVLTTGGDGFPAGPGAQLRWIDTLCHRHALPSGDRRGGAAHHPGRRRRTRL